MRRSNSSESFTALWVLPILLGVYFVSGFTALLYQVAWQRILGLFSGSDVRSVSIVVASYLLGLGIGSWISSGFSDRLSSRQAIQVYGCCNFGIAAFAVSSRFLFYDLLFLQWQPLSQSMALMLLMVFLSLLIPTTLMGLSLPLVTKAISHHAHQVAPRIGLLYGVNTLGSGAGALISGWYIIGTIGYEWTIYLGAALSTVIGIVSLGSAHLFVSQPSDQLSESTAASSIESQSSRRSSTATVISPLAERSLKNSLFTSPPTADSRSPFSLQWPLLVFLSGFMAISLEIIWFRILDVVLQSIAYTYAHLLAFILLSNGLGSMAGAAAVQFIAKPRRTFLLIQGGIAAYSIISIWLITFYWQTQPLETRLTGGYIDPGELNATVFIRYIVLPLVMLVPPNFLMGVYFPIVQKAVQKDDQRIGQRVGLMQAANILGNTTGSLLTGLVLLDQVGTAGALRLLAVLGLGFIGLVYLTQKKVKLAHGLTIVLLIVLGFFPNNTRLWAALQGIPPHHYFIAAEDSTGVAAITETNQEGRLLASGQAQAKFPYMQVHAVLGSLPALIHPHPDRVMIIGLGSGGTAHTAGVNPLTQQIQVVELLGAELTVLQQYAKTSIGQPLAALFQDPRYEFIVGDGRQKLEQSPHLFDIVEADAIYPWQSRAGMLYSQEFFQAVRSHLAPGGMFVEWNVGAETEPTFRNVFPYVLELAMSGDLSILIGSDRPVYFNQQDLLTKLETPAVLKFLANARVNVEALRQDVKSAGIKYYSQLKDGQPQALNTDLFPRSEYYLN